MKKVYTFQNYVKIFEGGPFEETDPANKTENAPAASAAPAGEKKANPAFARRVKLILKGFYSSYDEQNKLAAEKYGNIEPDYQSVVKAKDFEDQLKKMATMLDNINKAADPKFPECKDAANSLSDAGKKFIEAISDMGKNLKENKGNVEDISKEISNFFNDQLENLKKSGSASGAPASQESKPK